MLVLVVAGHYTWASFGTQPRQVEGCGAQLPSCIGLGSQPPRCWVLAERSAVAMKTCFIVSGKLTQCSKHGVSEISISDVHSCTNKDRPLADIFQILLFVSVDVFFLVFSYSLCCFGK